VRQPARTVGVVVTDVDVDGTDVVVGAEVVVLELVCTDEPPLHAVSATPAAATTASAPKRVRGLAGGDCPRLRVAAGRA